MKKIKKLLSNKYFIFLISFLLMFAYLFVYVDLMEIGGDAYETWRVVETFFSKTKYYSYVMYKGIYAFIPGIICYNLGNFLTISPMILMKCFHSIGFSYITTIGMPFLMENIFDRKIKTYQKYLFIILFWILENSCFNFISVDFMSFCILLLSFNSLFKIKNEKNNKIYSKVLCSSILIGLTTCLSGQYILSGILLLIYLVYLIFIKSKNKKQLISSFLILLMFFSLTKLPNKLYERRIVNPARESGNWIPTGKQWIENGFTSNMLIINFPSSIPDNLGKKIIKNEKIDEKIISNGGTIYSYKGMIKVIFKYPIIFVIRWTERLFLGIVNDPLNLLCNKIKFPAFLFIIIMGTMLFISLYEIKIKNKKIKDLISFNTIIVMSCILASLVPSFLHVENRYYLSIQTLIIGTFCYSPFLNNILFLKSKKNKKRTDIKSLNINYTFIEYIIFLIFLILLYVALYQSMGNDIVLLINLL